MLLQILTVISALTMTGAQRTASPEIVASFRGVLGGCSPEARHWIRAAFHECGTFDLRDGSGGNTGSLQFEAERPENRGLESTIGFYRGQSQRFGISFADSVVIGGIVAVEACQGQMGVPITIGRIDNTVADPAGRLPGHSASAEESKAQFITRMGLTADEAVALLGGGHTVATVNLANSPALVPGNLDSTVDVFDNKYLQEILQANPANGTVRIPADRNMMLDPLFNPAGVTFAQNNNLFLQKFIVAYVKMFNMGAKFSNEPSTTSSVVPSTSTQSTISSTQSTISSTQSTISSTQSTISSTQSTVSSKQSTFSSTQSTFSSTQSTISSTRSTMTSSTVTRSTTTSISTATTSSQKTTSSTKTSTGSVKPTGTPGPVDPEPEYNSASLPVQSAVFILLLEFAMILLG